MHTTLLACKQILRTCARQAYTLVVWYSTGTIRTGYSLRVLTAFPLLCSCAAPLLQQFVCHAANHAAFCCCYDFLTRVVGVLIWGDLICTYLASSSPSATPSHSTLFSNLLKSKRAGRLLVSLNSRVCALLLVLFLKVGRQSPKCAIAFVS